MRQKPKKTNDNLSSLQTVDKLIHSPARLRIMAHLFVVENADFLYIMRQTDLTFGNLSSHLNTLEKAAYVTISKEFIGKKPHTLIKLTDKGREAFLHYKKNMQQFFNKL